MPLRKKHLAIALLVAVSITVAGCGTSEPPVPQHTLNTSVEGAGTILPESGSKFPNATLVNLTPLPSANWVFSNWSGPDGFAVVDNKILMDSDKKITGVFIENQNLYQGLSNAMDSAITAIQNQDGNTLQTLLGSSFELTDPEGAVSVDVNDFLSLMVIDPAYDGEVPSDVVVSVNRVVLEERTLSAQGSIEGTIDMELAADSTELGIHLTRTLSGRITFNFVDNGGLWKISSVDLSECTLSEDVVPGPAINAVLNQFGVVIQDQTGDEATVTEKSLLDLLASGFRYTNPDDYVQYQEPASQEELLSTFVIDKSDPEEELPADLVIQSIILVYSPRIVSDESMGMVEVSGTFDYELTASSVSENILFTETISGPAQFRMTKVVDEWMIEEINLGSCSNQEMLAALQ